MHMKFWNRLEGLLSHEIFPPLEMFPPLKMFPVTLCWLLNPYIYCKPHFVNQIMQIFKQTQILHCTERTYCRCYFRYKLSTILTCSARHLYLLPATKTRKGCKLSSSLVHQFISYLRLHIYTNQHCYVYTFYYHYSYNTATPA